MEKNKKKSSTVSKKSTVKKTVTKKAPAKNAEEVKKVEVKATKVETVKKPKREFKHSTFKILGLVILVVALLTWFIKGGSWDYTNAESISFVANETATKTGINELFLSLYYGINYYLVQLVFLAILGIFYGVVAKTNGYKAMVKKLGSLFKGKETVFTLIVTCLIAALTSVSTQPIVVVTFIPLIISVAKELKMNKVSTMLITFGALAVGLMGLTIGTYGINYAATQLGAELTDGLLYRLVVLVVGYLALNIFVLLFNKKHTNLEVVEEVFEESTEESKAKAWPFFVLFGILLVLVVLGYIGWNNVLGIEVFDNFHKWLTTEIVVGKDELPIFGDILGKITAFGSWDPFIINYIMIIVLVFTKFLSHIKLDALLENALAGLKKMAKPIALVAMAYSVFVLCYWSGITNTIVNVFNTGSGFNPYMTALGNTIADFLHVDVEYTGFAFGAFYAAKYANFTQQLLTIFAATSGFVALCAPTSVFALIGLSFTKLSYKDYVKAIWKFIVALLVVLALILTVVTYL